jgi:hypothetical protein
MRQRTPKETPILRISPSPSLAPRSRPSLFSPQELQSAFFEIATVARASEVGIPPNNACFRRRSRQEGPSISPEGEGIRSANRRKREFPPRPATDLLRAIRKISRKTLETEWHAVSVTEKGKRLYSTRRKGRTTPLQPLSCRAQAGLRHRITPEMRQAAPPFSPKAFAQAIQAFFPSFPAKRARKRRKGFRKSPETLLDREPAPLDPNPGRPSGQRKAPLPEGSGALRKQVA